MDKIAVISDLHGNLPALQAVLKDIEARDIGRIYCLGDLIGKGPSSGQIVDLVRERCETVVKGNWDDFVSKPTEFETVAWHQSRLGEERMGYLRALPFSAEFRMSGKNVRLFHASAESVYVRVQPWDAEEKRRAMFAACEGGEPDVVGYGDIHHAYLQYLGGKMLFNAGSVGNPLDIPQASYVIMEGVYGSEAAAPFALQFVRVPYDIELAVRQAQEERMPDLDHYARELRTAVYRGRKD